MTEQEIFDTVVNHLRTMPGRSVDPYSNNCAYRSSDGNKCAVGIILTDEEYAAMGGPDIEGASIRHLAYSEGFPSRLKPFTDLLLLLQRVHDHSVNWVGDTFAAEANLKFIAKDFNLAYHKESEK